MASRSQRKMWRNGPGGKWNCRIRWYDTAPNSRQATDEDNIKLVLEDTEMKIAVYPTTAANAANVWAMFRQGAPAPNTGGVVVADLLAILKGRNIISE